jgi:hypothetical protein
MVILLSIILMTKGYDGQCLSGWYLSVPIRIVFKCIYGAIINILNWINSISIIIINRKSNEIIVIECCVRSGRIEWMYC